MRHAFFYSLLLATLLLTYSHPLPAQPWMSNYSYRKLITIDKNKVSPTVISIGASKSYLDLVDFPVLIDLQDEDLIHHPGACGNKLSDGLGRDISFALRTAPQNPLRFQLESYHPASGRLRCWVSIPSLSAQMSPSAPTAIYLYYGATNLHDPEGTAAQQTWPADHLGLWHMNLDGLPPWCRNAKNNLPEQRLVASDGMDKANFQPSPLGTGIDLNGFSESLRLNATTGTSFTLSAWIKLRTVGREQVIFSNDSLHQNGATEGFTVKMNAAGRLVVELRKAGFALYSQVSQTAIEPGRWHYLCVTTTGLDIFFSLNAEKMQGKSGTSLRLGQGGSWRIGATKQGTSFFDGMIDELRIRQGVTSMEWIQTEYTNQKTAAAFYSLSPEEYASGVYKRFNGTIDQLWERAGNWDNGTLPSDNDNVLVSAGKTLRIQGLVKPRINKLSLESNATFSLGSDLSLTCKTELAAQASIRLDQGVKLTFRADVRNNGRILSDQPGAQLEFAGTNTVQQYYGAGTAEAYSLLNEQLNAADTLRLEAPVSVSGYLSLNKGILNANGMLRLSAGPQATAALLPIKDLNLAGILGPVRVEQYIAGNYPAPSTARGWKLLASPVYHKENNGTPSYNFSAYQSAMFITGPGGTANGFDSSPLNGGSIYTHNQSLPGNLSQKYQVIPNLQSTVAQGKGVYVFSRGSRFAPGAEQQQLLNAPFSNPDGYTITHIGNLYTGNLECDLFSNNRNQEGDGFNLLGNPYASAIVWSRLSKSNLSPFVWMFDQLNNAYTVTDLPETIIPAGAGFFVRVAPGSAGGSLSFTEYAKYNPETDRVIAAVPATRERMSQALRDDAGSSARISVRLSRGPFQQELVIKLNPQGRDSLDDQDALKIGEGHVSIASICGGQKLSIEEKALTDSGANVKLYIKGWGPGKYQISMRNQGLKPKLTMQLRDNYLQVVKKSLDTNFLYEFDINPEIPETQGEDRFILNFKPGSQEFNNEDPGIGIYPNPFKDRLYVSRKNQGALRILICNLYGQTIKTTITKPGENLLQNTGKELQSGLYLIRIYDGESGRYLKTLKAVRN